MKFERGKVVYEAEEVEKYSSLWALIRSEENLESRRDSLSKQLFWASDAGLGDGTDPLFPVVQEFAYAIKERALRLDPQLSADDLRQLVFYVLHHNAGSAEYDVSSPPN
jgi:hypothetical protein